MDHSDRTSIYGPQGLLGWLSTNTPSSDGQPVSIELTDGRTLHVPGDLLRQQPDGTWYLSSGSALAGARVPGQRINQHEQAEIVLPLAAEELRVDKKTTTHRVRFSKHVETHVERTEDTGFKEEIEIERVPVNREVDAPPAVRSEGSTTIVPLVEEVLVVEKRLILREEVRITVTRRPNPPVEATLRTERLDVEPPEAEA